MQSDVRQMWYKAGLEQHKTILGYNWRQALCLRCQARQEMRSGHAAAGRAWGWVRPAPNGSPGCKARLPEDKGERRGGRWLVASHDEKIKRLKPLFLLLSNKKRR